MMDRNSTINGLPNLAPISFRNAGSLETLHFVADVELPLSRQVIGVLLLE